MLPHAFSDVSTIDFFSFYKKHYSKINIIVLNLGKPIFHGKAKPQGCLPSCNIPDNNNFTLSLPKK